MKKLLFSIFAMSVANMAFATDYAKMLFVTKMYSEAEKTQSSLDVIRKYADPSLEQAFLSPEYCLEADHMFAGQDPDYSVKVTVYMENGKVIADLGYSKVAFTLTGSNGNYQVVDVNSLKDSLLCKGY